MTDPETTAYPIRHEDGIGIGLTKRELFAAMAMQGILSNPNTGRDMDPTMYRMAQVAVQFSDALIKALNETKE